MMLSLDTAYRSFGGEVEASSTPTICRLSDSRRHQLWAIAPQARGCQTEGRTRHYKKSRGLLREGIDMMFAFIAKHRGIWPAEWLCGALGVSRGGFYAWLTRPRSRRSRSEEELGAKVRASFLASDRTYGARRVWHDLLAEGVACGLHRIERLMRLQGLEERPST